MPGYGYREADRDRDASSDSRRKRRRGPDSGKDKQAKKDKKQRKRDRHEGDEKPPQAPAAAPGPASQTVDLGVRSEADPEARGAWRKELEASKEAEEDQDDGMMLGIETDEDVAKKLAESRARREALIAKWVTRGEGGDSFACPETNLSAHDEEAESDGEVAAFFAKQKEIADDNPKDEKAMENKRALQKFMLDARKDEGGDMFGENDDDEGALNRTIDSSAGISQTGASGDDWNDAEGYYKAKVGEVMAERYLVVEDQCGKGVFSTVIKAKDQQDGIMVAIKVMRCNDMMRKAAEKEIEVLQRLAAADRKNARNVIRMLRFFDYRDHLCVVFECMWDNLRVAMKKYTKDKGMSLKAIRAYTRQLVVALQHIHRCQLIHADIKPDNILITAGHNLVKICDLGSAVEFNEVEATPYLVSRFYRAPEICIAAKYAAPSDIWALGASLCELFTGKILFPGRSNNDMLKLFMEVKGKMPRKMIMTGTTWKQHFDENLDFKHLAYDKVTRKKVTRIITDLGAKRSILDMVMTRVGPEKQKSEEREDQLYVKKAKQFADLISQMTVFDPEKRATPEDLLQHPFVSDGGFGVSKPKGEKK